MIINFFFRLKLKYAKISFHSETQMKSVNKSEVLKLVLLIIPVCFLISLLSFIYGDLLFKNLLILFKLFAINNRNDLKTQNVSNSFSNIQLNSNQSNLTFIDYSIVVKQQLYLKTHHIDFKLPAQLDCGLSKLNSFSHRLKRIVRGNEAVSHRYLINYSHRRPNMLLVLINWMGFFV